MKREHVRPVSLIVRATDFISSSHSFDPLARKVCLSKLISEMKSNVHLAITADPEVLWDKKPVTCRDISYYFQFLLESR
jgi:hypothetical protein